jgi:hypothetical protein
MRLDVDFDVSFLSYAKEARALKPCARRLRWEDYVDDRVREILNLVDSHPKECIGRNFDLAMHENWAHASLIVVSKETFPCVHGATYDVYDCMVYNQKGRMAEFRVQGRPQTHRTLVHAFVAMGTPGRALS